jgi:hypothetical protein
VPDAALAAKQQLDHLCGAFGGLSDAHHEILVLRELEGLSYREIGERMGMSRPAVESTLFRARRRLSEEYDELASGQRCLRIQSIIATAGSGRLGARDTRRLARHVAHCQPCRRQALAAGVDQALVARRPVRQRAIEKVAALFPIPLLLSRRRGGGGPGDSWVSQLPAMSDHAAAGGAKLAAVAALVVAGLGAGVGTHVVQTGSGSDRPAARPAGSAGKPRTVNPTPSPRIPAATSTRSGAATTKTRRSGGSSGKSGRTTVRSLGSAARQTAPRPAAGGHTGGSGGAGVDAPANVPASVPSSDSAPSTPSTSGTGPTTPAVPLPKIELGGVDAPASTIDPAAAVQQVTRTVEDAAAGATGTVQNTTEAITQQTLGG